MRDEINPGSQALPGGGFNLQPSCFSSHPSEG
jgi:hypothetical protein